MKILDLAHPKHSKLDHSLNSDSASQHQERTTNGLNFVATLATPEIDPLVRKLLSGSVLSHGTRIGDIPVKTSVNVI